MGDEIGGLKTAGFVIRVTRYVSGACLPMHEHRNPNLCLITSGGFEDLALGWGRAGLGAAVMHPGGRGHAQRFADGGSLAINIDLDRAWLMDVGGCECAGPLRVSASEVMTAAAHVRLALRAREPETLIAATLARLLCGRSAAEPRDAATATTRALSCMAPGSEGRVGAIAREIGVDSSHLAREFSRRVGCSPSRALRWERAAAAVDLLERTGLPLATVALRAGYCDQSHLCREMKKFFGSTPRALRSGHRA